MHSELRPSRETLDIILITYNESNGDKNWLDLKGRFPRARRIHGVKGIREAHQQAALKSETPFFFVVDGDNRIVSDFDFTPPNENLDPESVYVYRCKNPVNDLVYGYGAVKIYSKDLLLNEPIECYRDFATQVTRKYKIINEVASESFFFASPEEAWRGAFRESFKLSTQIQEGKGDERSAERLETWCTKRNPCLHSEWVLLGARQGRDLANSNNASACEINDFEWLGRYFNEFAAQ